MWEGEEGEGEVVSEIRELGECGFGTLSDSYLVENWCLKTGWSLRLCP